LLPVLTVVIMRKKATFDVLEAREEQKFKKLEKSKKSRSLKSHEVKEAEKADEAFKSSRFQDFKISRFKISIFQLLQVLTSSKKWKIQKSMLRNSSMSSTEVELVGFRRYNKIPSVCMYVCLSVCMYVCDSCPALTTPTIFLIFGMKVGDH